MSGIRHVSLALLRALVQSAQVIEPARLRPALSRWAWNGRSARSFTTLWLGRTENKYSAYKEDTRFSRLSRCKE